MAEIPSCLTDESIEQTMALGREMETFLLRRMKAKEVDAGATVEPHPELLAQIAAVKSRYEARNGPAQD